MPLYHDCVCKTHLSQVYSPSPFFAYSPCPALSSHSLRGTGLMSQHFLYICLELKLQHVSVFSLHTHTFVLSFVNSTKTISIPALAFLKFQPPFYAYLCLPYNWTKHLWLLRAGWSPKFVPWWFTEGLISRPSGPGASQLCLLFFQNISGKLNTSIVSQLESVLTSLAI